MNIPEYDIITTLVAFSILVILIVSFFIAIVVQYQKRRRHHVEQLVALKNQYEQELLRSQLEIQEQTLRTISHEIHDNVGQVLSLAKLQLHSQQQQGQPGLQPSIDLLVKAISDLRDLSKSLHPDRIAEIGLAESIRYDLLLLQKTNAIDTHFDLSGTLLRLPPEKEILLFRMFQEMMNNVMKHAVAKLVTVKLQYGSAVLLMAVSDNGCGFSLDKPSGIGFTSLRTRAKLLNAQLDIKSNANGTTVALSVPIFDPKNPNSHL
ncbi:MAG: hypothetical protein EAY75_00500 [Bacteroidetes bacterium]|nr:MAG: hypothetical protein EAY75_00500 [Bacteroidota bacterium]